MWGKGGIKIHVLGAHFLIPNERVTHKPLPASQPSEHEALYGPENIPSNEEENPLGRIVGFLLVCFFSRWGFSV